MPSPEATTQLHTPPAKQRLGMFFGGGIEGVRLARAEAAAAGETTTPEITHDTLAIYDSIVELRKKQSDKLAELCGNAGPDITDNTYVDTFLAGIDDQLDEHLTGAGIVPGSENYDQIKRLSREASIDNVSDIDWYTSKTDANGVVQPSGRDQARDEIMIITGEQFPQPGTAEPTKPVSTETTNTKVDSANTTDTIRPVNPVLIEARENNETLKSAREKLSSLRDSLAAITAKQLGKPVTRNGKYNDARDAYNEALIYVGKLEETVLSQAKADRTDDEKNADTISYIFDEQKKLREATQELFANTKVSKFIEWFNRGGRLKRIGKGILVGAPIAVAGAIIAPVGIAGAAAVATGGVIGTRFARNYARHDNNRGIDVTDESIKEQNFVEVVDREDRTIENAVAYADAGFNTDKKHEQRERLKSAGWGVGGVFAGALAGEAIAFAADHGAFDGAVDWAKDHSPFGSKEVEATPGNPTGPNEPGVNQQPTTGETKPSVKVVEKDLTANQLFDGSKGSTEFTSTGLKDFNKWIEGHHVTSGESVWSLSKDYLQQEGVAHPSVFQIDAVKDSVLKEFQAKDIVNGRGWLSKGDIIKLK